jgi:hypothetical protein
VEQGYIKEWGDEAGIDAAAIKALSPRGSGLKRSPTFKLEDEDVAENASGDQDLDSESDEESERKSLIHNVQLLPTDSLWHVERGSRRVQTAHVHTQVQLRAQRAVSLIVIACAGLCARSVHGL